MTATARRVWYVLAALEDGFPNAETAAKRWNVSKRRVFEDLAGLRKAGLDLHADPDGRYRVTKTALRKWLSLEATR